MGTPQAIVIAGPTASGKSALATALAERFGGVVVNADSMQVYRELRIVTARPTSDDEARVPHRLYGHVAAADPYSVGRYVADVQAVLDEARARGLLPVIVGGTGLYLKALFDGLSPIPPVEPEVRAHWRQAAADAAPGALHRALAERDPEMAGRLAPGDTQRIVRALEVITSTGRSLAAWQEERGPPTLDFARCTCVVLAPPRADSLRAGRSALRGDGPCRGGRRGGPSGGAGSARDAAGDAGRRGAAATQASGRRTSAGGGRRDRKTGHSQLRQTAGDVAATLYDFLEISVDAIFRK